MIDLIMVLLFTTLIAYIAGYREVESLIRDGSWYGIWFRIKFWNYKWNLDSYHFMGGLRRLLNVVAFVLEAFWMVWFGYLLVDIFFFIELTDNIYWAMIIAAAHIPFYWWFWYYQRNIFMHIISRKKKHRQYKYLNPFLIKRR